MRVRALVAPGDGSVSMKEKELEVLGANEIVLRPELVGLCGTDLEIISAAIDPAYIRYPIALGHEWCGRTTADDGTPGDLVVVEGIIPCWNCRYCHAGLTNLCETYQEIGFTRDGAAADAISVPTALVHYLQPNVTPSQAVLAEPCAVVYHALSQTNLVPNARILIIGDGTIGLLSAHLATLWSPERVDVLGKREAQRDLATQAAVTEFFTDPEAVGSSYDLVIEAAGVSATVTTALTKARRGAEVLLLGLAGSGVTAKVQVDTVVNDNLFIHGSFSYSAGSYCSIVALLNAGAIHPEFLITHRFPLDNCLGAFAELANPTGARGKVVLEWSNGQISQ